MRHNFTIKSLLAGDSAQLTQLFEMLAAPAQADNLRHNTAEKLLAFLFRLDQFDESLSSAFTQLQQALIEQIANADDFYTNSQQPLHQALNFLLARARTWYPRESKSSQQAHEKISALILACAEGNSNALVTALNETQHWFESEDKRANMLEARLCETEINHLKMLSAECNVLDVINASLAGRPFPSELISGVTNTLKCELQHGLFIAGQNSPFWKTWQRLLPLLGQVFTDSENSSISDDNEQWRYRHIPTLLNELERSLNLPTSNPDFYRQWIEALNEQLMQAIKKQAIASSYFTALSYPEDSTSLHTRVTVDIFKQTDSVQQGDWILFHAENEQKIRCKLALKNPDANQLLFVDSTGRKVMSKSIKDFALCLSTGIAKKLPLISLDDSIAKLLHALIDAYAQKQQQQEAQAEVLKLKAQAAAELQRQEEALRAAEAKAAEQKRIAEELVARQAAAQKAMAEAAAIAAEKLRRANELALEQERERMRLEAEQAAEQLQRLQMANLHISALNLGARVELIQNHAPIRCKLAVIIAGTGKYIFADNLGRKVAELHREQLVQALLDKQLILLNNGDSFDDQLVKVIRGLRKDIS